MSFKRSTGFPIAAVPGLSPEVEARVEEVRRGERPATHLPLKELPFDLVVTASGKTVGEMIEERRAASRKASEKRLSAIEAEAVEDGSFRFADQIKEAIKARGGVRWLTGLDDKEFRQLATRVIERDLDADAQRVSHEEWLEKLRELDAGMQG